MRSFAIGSILLALSVTLIVALVTQPLVRRIVSNPPQVDAARLAVHVRHLSVELFPRSFDHGNIDLAADYILQNFKNTGAKVRVQEVPVQEATHQNIIAHFGPNSGPLLVVGAHYDSFANTVAAISAPEGYSPETHTPGADDSASGIAGLLELARLLAQDRPSIAVELVAYTHEEPPHFRTEHMGSVWHARSLAAANRRVELMLALEMIGYFSDQPASQSFPLPGLEKVYTDRGDFIALVGRMGDFERTREVKGVMAGATDLPVYSINAPAFFPGIDFSDHRSYWAEGFPAMMVTDTGFYRNGNYHRAGDTYEKLDYRRMAKVVQSVYAVVQHFPPN